MSYNMPSSFASRGMIKSGIVVFLAFCLFVSVLKMGYAPSPPQNWSIPGKPKSQSDQYSNTHVPTSESQLEHLEHAEHSTSTTSEPWVPSPIPAGKTEDEQRPMGLSEEEAKTLCEANSFEVHSGREKRKVYDLFLAGSELDWLDIRLNTLYDYVDYFVIIEASKTFTYQPKSLYFKDNWERYEKFADKIIYRVLDFEGLENNSTWEREKFQRNSMFTAVFPSLLGAQAANDDDVLLVSDLDEIPKEETITLLKNCQYPERVTIRSNFYYYSFQFEHHGSDWNHPQATFYQGKDTILPEDLRMGAGMRDLRNASWHCSSCFATVAEMSKKIESFSHTEYNHARFKDPAQIVRRVRNGLDLFDRGGQDYDRIENNQDLPTYLKHNKDRYPWIVDRDPPNANFIDFNGEGAKSLDEFKGDMNDKRRRLRRRDF